MLEKGKIQFKEALIPKSLFLKLSEADIEDREDLFDLNPSAIVRESSNEFQLTLSVYLQDISEGIAIEVEIVGLFAFEGSLSEIRPFVSLNAPAILFPYLRSYITTLTSLSGFNAIILPTMNLMQFRETIDKNLILE